MRTLCSFCLLAVLVVAAFPTQAQRHGRITTTAFQVEYPVSAEAGETISVTMTRTSGDLIPFVAIMDAEGTRVFARSDVALTGRQAVLSYTTEAAGSFVVIASRIDVGDGTTTGDYLLDISRGNSSLYSPLLPWGTSAPPASVLQGTQGMIEGKIDDGANVAYYLVRLQAGERFRAALERLDGDLQPILTLLTLDEKVVQRGNMDADTRAVLVTTIEESGWYLLAAARFDVDLGTTSGRYRLTYAHS